MTFSSRKRSCTFCLVEYGWNSLLTAASEGRSILNTSSLPIYPFATPFFPANVTGTPFQYVGVGYNLFDGNPSLSTDPGLLLNRRILQVNFKLQI